MHDPPIPRSSTLSGTPKSPDERFLASLDSQLASILRSVDGCVELAAIQREARHLCQELTDSREKHGRLGVEANKLLYPDWELHWAEEKLFYTSLFDQWIRGKLDGQQADYLGQAIEQLIRFAAEDKTDHIRHRIAQELRGTLGDYLSLRGFSLDLDKPNADASRVSWFESPPPENSKFKHGPLEVSLALLSRWLEMDWRTLRKQNGKASWWIVKETRTRYLVWFTTEKKHSEVKQKKTDSLG